jgi:SMI1 / KNR4 family (SUKH-1)
VFERWIAKFQHAKKKYPILKVRMLAIAETLKQFWLRQGIKLRPGATEEELTAFKAKYKIRLPQDLREYLATVDGFDGSEHWMTDNEVITFLGLDEMKPLCEYWSPTVADSHSYFVFADYSLAAHVYAIRLDASMRGNDVVVVYDRTVAVARSFSEFIEGYLENSGAVLFPEPQA